MSVLGNVTQRGEVFRRFCDGLQWAREMVSWRGELRESEETMARKQYYELYIFGDVDPSLEGPYSNADEQTAEGGWKSGERNLLTGRVRVQTGSVSVLRRGFGRKR